MQLTDVTDFVGLTNTRAHKPTPPDNPKFDVEKVGEKKILYAWKAAARTQKKGVDKKFLRTLFIIAVVVALFLITMQEYFLILVIASLIFISYILSVTPPEEVKYEISNHGVNYDKQFYYWSDLKQYFFTTNAEGDVLNVDVKEGLPGRLFLTVRPGDKNKLHELFGKYLPFSEEMPGKLMNKAYTTMISKFNLGND